MREKVLAKPVDYTPVATFAGSVGVARRCGEHPYGRQPRRRPVGERVCPERGDVAQRCPWRRLLEETARQPAAAPADRPEGRRARLLGKLLAGRVDRDRQVQVGRCRLAEQMLQVDLALRRAQEVGAANDVGDALLGIVDDDGELVGEEPIAALDQEVADVPGERLVCRGPGAGR